MTGRPRTTKTATTVLGLVDRSKIGGASLAPFCDWGDLDVLVTDATPPAKLAAALREAGVRVLVAPPEPAVRSRSI